MHFISVYYFTLSMHRAFDFSVYKSLLTVLKSLHVHKKSHEQYFYSWFKRVICLRNMLIKYNLISISNLQLSNNIYFKFCQTACCNI